jgi:hypothetical protein
MKLLKLFYNDILLYGIKEVLSNEEEEKEEKR